MSRALDKDTVSAISSGKPSAAYEAISTALAQTCGSDDVNLLEIEILNNSHHLETGTFLLRDENALAFSKLALVQAFTVARSLFMRNRSEAAAVLLPDELHAVTNVILLMDPESLSAANARKRLIAVEASASNLIFALKLARKDRFFVDSLLTSRLHRHTKSPTLWSHRQWLAEFSRSHGSPLDVIQDLSRVVMVAGERHPRNYYAWRHARWLTMLICADEEGPVMSKLVESVKQWCFRNHTDISGWSFLSFLLLKVDAATRSFVFNETLNYVGSFQWVNESTWVFLRTLAANGAVEEAEVLAFQTHMEQLFGDLAGNGRGRRVMEQAQSWFKTYQRRHVSQGEGQR